MNKIQNIYKFVRNTAATLLVLMGLSGSLAFIHTSPAEAATCGGVETSLIDCGGQKDATKLEDTGVWNILLIVVNVLTAGVGVLALGGIIYGAVMYTSAGGNPEMVKKARTIFTNVVIGVIAYAGMYALLQFLVPGGVFN